VETREKKDNRRNAKKYLINCITDTSLNFLNFLDHTVQYLYSLRGSIIKHSFEKACSGTLPETMKIKEADCTLALLSSKKDYHANKNTCFIKNLLVRHNTGGQMWHKACKERTYAISIIGGIGLTPVYTTCSASHENIRLISLSHCFPSNNGEV